MTTLTRLDEVARLVAAARTPGRRLIVGIAGAPGSGKSTIGARLVDAIGPEAALLGMDGYHLPQARLVELGRRDRMGAADTFDVDAFAHTLDLLRRNDAPVLARGFDREIEEPVEAAVLVPEAAAIVVVEGNYLLYDAHGWGRVAPYLDLTFFVRLDHDERVRRLVARHVLFGKTPQAARAWADGPDETNARIIEATAGLADHVIALD